MNWTNRFSGKQIVEILDSLSIGHTNKPNTKGWINLYCPYHSAKKITNAMINVYHGGFMCFSCKTTGDIIDIVEKIKGFSFKETLEFLNINDQQYYKDLVSDANQKTERMESTYNPKMGELSNFDPLEWKYTRERGITKEWLEWSGSKLNTGGKYNDYLIIPIIDQERNIYEYEARKLKEYEYLISYYGFDEESKLKDQWEEEKKKNRYEIEYDNQKKTWYCESIKGPVYDYRVVYLTRGKALYRNARILDTIFRREFLRKDLPLYIEEGLGADSKNRQLFPNLTCTFGSNLSDSQLQIFKEFKEIIVIPDNDRASSKMISRLTNNHTNVKVLDKQLNDKQSGYIEELKKAPVIDAYRWLYRHDRIQTR